VLQAQMDAMALRNEEKRESFEAKVFERLDTLQAKMEEMEEKEDQIGVTICRLVQGELTETEESIMKRLEQRLKVHEEQSVKRFEEYSKRTTHAFEKLESRVEKMLKQCEGPRIEAVVCQVQRLEYRMETEMRQLYHGMYRAQGRFNESDSDDDRDERIHLFEELPGHVDESDEEDAEVEGLEENCEPTSPLTSANDENEWVHEHSIDLKGTREGDHIACPSGEEGTNSIGAEMPSHREDASWLPNDTPRPSCELACTPQVKACFGVLGARSSKEKSHEDSSGKEEEHTGSFEAQERNSTSKGQVVTQVWVPRGTLEVIELFNMTEIKLGEKSGVSHKAKKKRRRRRRKSSNPQGVDGGSCEERVKSG
ncbi:hypothetical protein, partial [Candidatus Burkholderia verschuerenii]|uniref:hypothetical protein n=1 Tax=Candidatus Burkholderia verschuerenii TaxID=242163 RepID=UPI0018DD8D4E